MNDLVSLVVHPLWYRNLSEVIVHTFVFQIPLCLNSNIDKFDHQNFIFAFQIFLSSIIQFWDNLLNFEFSSLLRNEKAPGIKTSRYIEAADSSQTKEDQGTNQPIMQIANKSYAICLLSRSIYLLPWRACRRCPYLFFSCVFMLLPYKATNKRFIRNFKVNVQIRKKC